MLRVFLFSISKKTGVDFELKSLNLSNAASFNPVPLNAHIVGGTADAKLNLAFANEDAKIHEVKHFAAQRSNHNQQSRRSRRC